MSSRERLLLKVQKLLALAADQNSMAEASAAAAKAQELIERYKIEQAELESAGGPESEAGSLVIYESDPRTARGKTVWLLAHELAPAYDCFAFLYRHRGRDFCLLSGRRCDLEIAQGMLLFLAREIDKAFAGLGALFGRGRTVEFSFRRGMVFRLRDRVMEVRDGLRSGASARALVILRDRAAEAEARVRAVGPIHETRSRNRVDGRLEFLGACAADNVELTRKIEPARATA